MKLITGRAVPNCFLYDTPKYTYVLRYWFDDPIDGESTCANVVVFRRTSPMTPQEIYSELENDFGASMAKKFHLIDFHDDVMLNLDTWDSDLEVLYADPKGKETRMYKNWWLPDMCEEVFNLAL